MFLYSTSDADAHMQAKGSKERTNFARAVIAEQGWSELEIIESSWEYCPGALTTKGATKVLAGLGGEGSNPRCGERRRKNGVASV